MSRTGRSLTSHMEIEPRQHELVGLDLGEGPKRSTLVFGIVTVVVWCVLLSPIVGVPDRFSISLYLIPPALIVVFGTYPSSRLPRRKTLTDWALTLRYAVMGHRPLIRLGARHATRAERVPIHVRFAFLRRLWGRVVPTVDKPAWAEAADTGPVEQQPIGRRVRLHQTPVLISGQQLYDELQTKTTKKKRGEGR